MLPEMICICLKSQTPNRLILRYMFKFVYPTVVYVELPKWRCPISERHQQLGPKRRYLIQLLTEIEINVVVFSIHQHYDVVYKIHYLLWPFYCLPVEIFCKELTQPLLAYYIFLIISVFCKSSVYQIELSILFF